MHAEERRDVRRIYLAAVGVMLLTSLPYFYGWSLQGRDARHQWYSGFPHAGLVDNCVYAAWLRQAADGKFFEVNPFTTRPQSGVKVNVYYALVGRLTAAVPARAAFQLERVVLGVLLLRGLWWLTGLFAAERRARWLSWWCLCFSSGLGWLWALAAPGAHPSPTDLWQPEGFTFLSLYWSPHFLPPLLLMTGVVGWMIVAERRRSYAAAALAGLCGLVLADIHTYDLVPLALAWALFLAARALRRGRLDADAVGRALLAAAVAAPGAAYMAWLLRADAVFAARAAVLTPSPPLYAYALGYGLTLALAVYAAARAAREDESVLLLACWAAASLAAAYLPVAFQRKLVMGAHLPLAILAGLAIARLTRRLRGARAAAAAAALVAALAPSDVLFLARDAAALRSDPGPIRAYLTSGEREALSWLEAHAAPDDALQPLPWLQEDRPGAARVTDVSLALHAPWLTGRRVSCAHVGETPSFEETLYRWALFCLPGTPEDVRRAWLRAAGARWLVLSQKREGRAGDLLRLFARPPAYLRRVPEASGPDAEVFEARLRSSAPPPPAPAAAPGA